MANQLYRTNISLTGNVKLGCWITDQQIEKCALAPVSSNLPIVPQEVNLDGSVSLGYDIKKFYDSHSDIFYSPQIPERLISTGQYKHLSEGDFTIDPNFGDGQYGLKRVSNGKNGKQLSVFAPIFIKYAADIPAGVRFIIQTGSGLKDVPEKEVGVNGSNYQTVKNTVTPPTFLRKITIPIKGTILGDYLERSYRGINGTNVDGSDIENIHIINIDPSHERCTTRGWSMESGDLCEVQSDLMRRIFNMNLTLQEFDSYICDEYRTFQMICPWILNLCWYFNIYDLMPDNTEIIYGQAVKIDVEYLDANGDVIPSGDLDVNHRLVGQTSLTGQTDGTAYLNSIKNAMDQMGDWRVSEIWNDLPGKLTPITNKWSLSGSYNSYIFNMYPGFDQPELKWRIPYFMDSYESNPNNAISNPTRWMRTLVSKTACTSGFNIKQALLGGEESIWNIYYSDKISNERIKIDSFVRFTDYNDWVICNGAKYNILLDNIKDLLKSNPVDNESALDDDMIIGNGNTAWSISLMYNNTDMTGENPTYIILYTPGEGNIIKYIDIIIWMPYKDYPLSDFTLMSNRLDKIPGLDTYIVKCTTNNVVPWQYKYVGVKNIFGSKYILKYIDSEICEIPKTLYSLDSDKGYSYKGLTRMFDNGEPDYESCSGKFSVLNKSNIKTPMNRYFGWIQPRVIPVGSMTYNKMSDHVEYTRNMCIPSGDPAEDWCFTWMRDVEDFTPCYNVIRGNNIVESGYTRWGDECLQCILSYGGDKKLGDRIFKGDMSFDNYIKHYYLTSRIESGCKDNPWSARYKPGYEYWGSLEWKCYDASQALYLPETVMTEIPMDSNDKYKSIGDVEREALMNVCISGMTRTTVHPEYFINRIMKLYNINIDTDINKTKYIIKFTLK